MNSLCFFNSWHWFSLVVRRGWELLPHIIFEKIGFNSKFYYFLWGCYIVNNYAATKHWKIIRINEITPLIFEHQKVQNHDTKEKNIKWSKPYECPSFWVELCSEWCPKNRNQNISMSLQSLGERDLNEGRYLERRILEWVKLQMKITPETFRGVFNEYWNRKAWSDAWFCQGDKGRYLLSGMPQSMILRWNYVCVYKCAY